jgi:hypothetical protein
VSEDEINALFELIKSFDGYPRLRDLRKMAPSLTPLQINTIVKYLERSGAIIIDSESYIVWARRGREEGLTLGDAANISSEFRDYLKELE